MDIRWKCSLAIGGAGFIGSHTVDHLLKQDVAEIRIYDNFCRLTHTNISSALKDSRVNIFPYGGDILHRDLLNKAKEELDFYATVKLKDGLKELCSLEIK